MYKIIYPKFDATLYSRFPEKNTGMDQILELGKQSDGEPSIENNDTVFFDKTYNSRILFKFDLTDVSASIVSGKIDANTARYYLNISATEATALPLEYEVQAWPVSGTWTNGTGYYNNDPDVTNGVSWKYRTAKSVGNEWPTGSYGVNATGSYGGVVGGGTWYTSSYASQSFFKEKPDVRMDVTNIVRLWLSQSIQNNGIIVKFSNTLEQDQSILGNIKFFSVESHTIFVPRLEVYWNQLNHSGTGSFSEINSDDFVLHGKNLRMFYSNKETSRVRFFVRERYPNLTYGSSSYVTTAKRLPANSWYQIQDVVTDEIILNMDSIGTKVDCDSNGNYINLDFSGIMPERKYKLILKCEFDNGDTIRYVDENLVFGVRRN